MENEIKTIKRVSQAIELQREMESLIKKMRYDINECKNILSPYCNRYGMNKGDLLEQTLETYHQLRLKEGVNKNHS